MKENLRIGGACVSCLSKGYVSSIHGVHDSTAKKGMRYWSPGGKCSVHDLTAPEHVLWEESVMAMIIIITTTARGKGQ